MTEQRPTVLVVDDKRNMLRLMTKVLKSDAHVLSANSGASAVQQLRAHTIDVVLCDLRMPDMDGIEVLQHCKTIQPAAEFVLMTAHASAETAIEALRLGAYDYLTKPFEPDAARQVVLRAMGRAAATMPEGDPETAEVLPDMLGRSDVMKRLGDLVERVAESDATVILLGETGTGKERVARAIHRLSPRASSRFVAVNCAAIPGELMESELFGHTRGAFTGASQQRKGLFEEAHRSTLFLDEIGEMRLSLQAKLTRVLEERAIRRIGESIERPIDVRLIAATHRNIAQMVASESFREDLWYRLNVAAIPLPPLRDRREDIELLATHFLRERPTLRGRRIVGFTPAAMDVMRAFSWPGNVRQLRAAVERASIVGSGERIGVADLPPEVVHPSRPTANFADLDWATAQKRGQTEVARRYLRAVLAQYDGRISEAAAHAGVERESFYRLLRRYEVDPARQ